MSDSSSSGASVDTTPAPKRPFDATRFLIFAGLALLYMTCAAFLLICFRLYRSGYAGDLQSYIPEMILFVVGSLSAFFGVSLLRTVGLATIVPKAVINPTEWEDIRDKVKDGNEDTVTQYVRLSSLTGFTGFFTKLGLQGLPLATIGLTIFFSLLFMVEKDYLDLAKLTLGAFIGSFVQRQITASQTVKLPSGGTAMVSPPPPV